MTAGMDHLRHLSRDDLLKLVEVYARNWLAHDGCWFLAAEERLGMDVAMELDTHAWRCFSPVEARRIMAAFGIAPGSGLAALERALKLRLYAAINPQVIEWTNEGALRLHMLECRVQQTRRHKGLPDFPCKSVGMVEYTEFARAIDPRIETVCIACPPDPVTDGYCTWEFCL